MDVRGPRVIQGDFEQGFRSRFHYAGLNIIIETVKQLDVPVPATGSATRTDRGFDDGRSW